MIAAVDWDGTLVDTETQEWLDGALAFLTFAKRHAWNPVVHSSRALSPGGKLHIEETLVKARHGDVPVIPKFHADAYVDNLAVPYLGSWVEVRDKVRLLAKA